MPNRPLSEARIFFWVWFLLLFIPQEIRGETSVTGIETDLTQIISRITSVVGPVSREASGTCVLQSPETRYRLRFRLLARDPENLRWEFFDPFGRPILYIFVFQGRMTLYSSSQKAVLSPSLLPGPWTLFPALKPEAWLKVLWGRIPLLPHETSLMEWEENGNPPLLRLTLIGADRQECGLTMDPFTLVRSRISRKTTDEVLEIRFSDFFDLGGARWPKRIEFTLDPGGYYVSLLLENLEPLEETADAWFRPPPRPPLTPSGETP